MPASLVSAALRQDQRERPGAEEEAIGPEDRKRVLDALIDERLLLQVAQRHELRIRPEELELRLEGLRFDYPGETFQAMLQREGLSQEDLEASLERRLLIERLFEREVYARVAITDEEISAWIEAKPEAALRKEQVRAAQIVVKSEEEAEALLVELRKGADFAEQARERSLSPDAKFGGDLGWFGEGEMPPPFEEACSGLRPGQLSPVVESPYGFHIFQVIERRPAGALEESELREEVEKLLRRERELEMQEEFLAELRSQARIHIHNAALSRLVVKP